MDQPRSWLKMSKGYFFLIKRKAVQELGLPFAIIIFRVVRKALNKRLAQALIGLMLNLANMESGLAAFSLWLSIKETGLDVLCGLMRSCLFCKTSQTSRPSDSGPPLTLTISFSVKANREKQCAGWGFE